MGIWGGGGGHLELVLGTIPQSLLVGGAWGRQGCWGQGTLPLAVGRACRWRWGLRGRGLEGGGKVGSG